MRNWLQSVRSVSFRNTNNKKRHPILQSVVATTLEPLEQRVFLTAVAPTADTFVRDNDQTLVNFGGSSYLYVQSANGSGADDRVAFLKFDLTNVSNIRKATLNLQGELESKKDPDVDVSVLPVADSSWVEGNGDTSGRNGDGVDIIDGVLGGMTWNNQPAVGDTPIGKVTIDSASFQTVSVDVTSYLQQQKAAGNNIVTLALKSQQPTADWVRFESKESGNSSAPQLVIDDSAPAAPSATLSAPDVTQAGDGTETVTVVYQGSSIDASTIGKSDLTVTRADGFTVPVTGAVASASGATVTATYTITSPANKWVAVENGTYTVSLNSGEVLDSSGTPTPTASTTFGVKVDDVTAPTAQIFASNLSTKGGSTYTFQVLYTDDVAVDPTSIDVGNVSVKGPGGNLKVTKATVASSDASPTVTATYTVAAPNGTWSGADDGNYTITLKGQKVQDTAGNASPSQTGNFTVNIPVPDTTAPKIVSLSSPDVTGAGGTTQTVTAIFSDNNGLDASKFAASNLTVTGPGGAVAVSSFSVVASNSTTATVQYTFTPPGGTWDSSDNGTYTATIAAGKIADNGGNTSAAASATFHVSATPADSAPPTATISTPSVTTAGGTTQTVTVIYTDNVAVDPGSIGKDDLSASGPAGALTVASVTTTPGSNGKTLTAVYTLTPPGGAWSAGANGAYTVSLNANAVRDSAGNAASATPLTFNVAVPMSNPADATFAGGNTVAAGFVAESVVAAPDGHIFVAGHRAVTGGTQAILERLNSDGSIDTTFGTQGIVATAGTSDAWYGLVLQGGTHLVAVGGSAGDFAIERFDLSGHVDTSFAASGKATADFGTTADNARSVAIDASGNLIVGGDSNGHFAFARYSANGALDTSFGQGGRQLFAVGASGDALGGVAVQADGKIVAVGSSGGNVAVVRLRGDGEPDNTFSGDGELTVTSLMTRQDSTAPDFSEAIAIQSDGRILVANRTAGGKFGLARITSDGNLDSTFGTNGIATASFGGDDDADSIVIQGSGQILVVGTTLSSSGAASTAVAAFDANGTLIPSFGTNGLATFATGVGATASPHTLRPQELHVGDLVLRAFGTVQSNGRLLVGTSNVSTTTTTDGTSSSSLRRILVPGAVGVSSTPPTATPAGTFGAVGKKNVKLTLTDLDGTKVTFALTGATGTVTQSGNTFSLTITSVTKSGASLTITGKGGNARVTLADMTVAGKLTRFTGTNTDLTGTIAVAGGVGTVALGNVDGTFAAAGAIGTFKAASLSSALVFSGVNLGADGKLNGGDDTFGQGSIGTLKITNSIDASIVAAGLNYGPDGVLLSGDDTVVNGPKSVIKSISAKNAAATTQFVAGAIKSASLPKHIKSIAADTRFRIL